MNTIKEELKLKYNKIECLISLNFGIAIMAVMVYKESFRGLATCAWFGHVTLNALQTLKVIRSKVMTQKLDPPRAK